MDANAGTPPGEETLVARLRRGAPGAFEELIRDHRAAVYGTARRLLGSHDGAEEVAQETFIRAWRGIRSFRGDAAIRTWLLTIAVHAARSYGARLRLEEGLESAPEPIARGVDPAERVGLEEARRRVKAAVARLAPRQREVMMLKVFSDMTYPEVARVLGLTVGAVKAHVHQATSNLRRLLAEEDR